jgi:FkbM family methyltransferase
MVPIRNFTFESDFFNVPCHEIVVEGHSIRYVGTTRLAHARLTSVFDKEPTTIPWLGSLRETDILVDIGASIGMYTIYAAAFSGCRVYAFEPESLNYAELNKNIHVNGVHQRAAAFCFALADEAEVDYLISARPASRTRTTTSPRTRGSRTWTEAARRRSATSACARRGPRSNPRCSKSTSRVRTPKTRCS